LSNSNFKIINAGAGSGKTFSLVLEYLTFLIDPKLELNHRSLLAITFTNKAVNELKSRILNKLFLLKTNPSEEKIIIDHLKNKLKITDDEIKFRSDLILKKIIYDYGSFDIITIDSFTHRIIRTFSRDFKLSTDFEVVLDNKEILSDMVDSIINEVGVKKDITENLLSYSLYRISDGKSMNIKNNLIDFAKILLNENNRIPLASIMKKSDKTFKKNYKILKDRILLLQTEIKKLSVNALDLIHKTNLEKKDFYRGTLYNYFEKLKNLKFDFSNSKNLEDSLSGLGQLYSKNKEELIKEKINLIRPNLNQFYFEIKLKVELFFLTKSLINNWIPLSLSSLMGNKIEEIESNEKKILIDNFNSKISSIIKDQPAPYIFERLGERYKHYFIDEFQDTSILQWSNLIPLISNSLETEYKSDFRGCLYLVGDPKQAIYRWRGGDVNQFINLNLKNSPFQINPEIRSLNINYRSKNEIVKFNSDFFKKSSIFLSDKTYSKIFEETSLQLNSNNPGGYITVNFIPKSRLKSESDDFYLKLLYKKVLSVLSRGYKINQIAVLVRKKRQAVLVSEELVKNGIKILSSESLLINNSDSVRFLISLMRLLINQDNIRQYKIILDYLWSLKFSKSLEYHSFLKRYLNLDKEHFFRDLSLLLKNNFDYNKFSNLNIYDGIEYAISNFNFIKTSDVYVIHFLDIIFNFSINRDNNIYAFINYWDENYNELCISMPEKIDALRVLTIHKAKGLEFPVVIIPFLDEPFISKRISNHVWFPIDKNNLKDFEWGLVNYSDKLKEMGSVGQETYNYHKKLFEYDAMTILYVAMTRAKKELHIITKDTNQANSPSYSSLFLSYCQNLRSNNNGEFEWGKSNINTDLNEDLREDFVLNVNSNLKWKNKIYYDSSLNKFEYKRKEGLLLHELLSQINSIDEIDFVIKNHENLKILNDFNVRTLKSKILKIFNHKKLKNLFNNDNKIYNEKEILNPKGKILRPDKIIFLKNKTVIVDFKSGKFRNEHIIQMKEYEESLKKMNYSKIEKILIYINDSIDIKMV
tara:strand:+ start:1016 stop:4132 length:3117 start_codon:yes stop_codon:yes gene_type:complete